MAHTGEVAENSGMNEACGVFGCVSSGPWPSQLDVSHIICLGITGLQHRGQESAGIVTSTGESCYDFTTHRAMGLVNSIFTDENLKKLRGNLGIGHTRYSTAGCSEMTNCQPFVVETLHGLIGVAHNGELVNANALKQFVLQHGCGLSSGSDSELITQLLSHSPPGGEPNGPDWMARIKQLMAYTLTAYSLLVMHKDSIFAVRDPFGNRPLCIGRVITASAWSSTSDLSQTQEESCEGWIVSSESCSFQAVGAKYYREILPGEIVQITKEGVKSLCIVPRPNDAPSAFCIFEYVYFARPDSILEGQMVYTVRQRCGQQLARESPCAADIVSTVPESATPAAIGFAQESGLPYVEVLCKNRYVGRTFIQPNKRLRQLGVAKKFGALTDNLKGKSIVIVDDSIVRGNTMGPIVKLLRLAGAAEVHIRIASPPIKHTCSMGINIPTKDELISNKVPESRLADYLGADSVVYLSVEGLVKAVQQGIENKVENKVGHCTACLTGVYPVALEW